MEEERNRNWPEGFEECKQLEKVKCNVASECGSGLVGLGPVCARLNDWLFVYVNYLLLVLTQLNQTPGCRYAKLAHSWFTLSDSQSIFISPTDIAWEGSKRWVQRFTSNEGSCLVQGFRLGYNGSANWLYRTLLTGPHAHLIGPRAPNFPQLD